MQHLYRRASLFLAANAFLVIWSCRLFAQSATGEVTGTITDNTGGSVAGATVKLSNTATGATDQAQTNSSGSYTFINVQAGPYVMTVENAGFKTAQAKFEMSVNQTVTENLTLELGSVSETVSVSAEAPLVQQSSTNLGTVIAEQAVRELPLNGRNFTQLMILARGKSGVDGARERHQLPGCGCDGHSGHAVFQAFAARSTEPVCAVLPGRHYKHRFSRVDLRSAADHRCGERVQGAVA